MDEQVALRLRTDYVPLTYRFLVLRNNGALLHYAFTMVYSRECRCESKQANAQRVRTKGRHATHMRTRYYASNGGKKKDEVFLGSFMTKSVFYSSFPMKQRGKPRTKACVKSVVRSTPSCSTSSSVNCASNAPKEGSCSSKSEPFSKTKGKSGSPRSVNAVTATTT